MSPQVVSCSMLLEASVCVSTVACGFRAYFNKDDFEYVLLMYSVTSKRLITSRFGSFCKQFIWQMIKAHNVGYILAVNSSMMCSLMKLLAFSQYEATGLSFWCLCHLNRSALPAVSAVATDSFTKNWATVMWQILVLHYITAQIASW